MVQYISHILRTVTNQSFSWDCSYHFFNLYITSVSFYLSCCNVLYLHLHYRYCFLAFGYDERVVANRDNCRLLLIRLKMDGWALGRSKVFLKYYHVEFLSKMYEEQLKKIVMVQACVRRWLARIRFKKQKWQFAVSVVTLQRHIRGWLSRKHLQEQLKKKEEEEEATVLQKLIGNFIMFTVSVYVLFHYEIKGILCKHPGIFFFFLLIFFNRTRDFQCKFFDRNTRKIFFPYRRFGFVRTVNFVYVLKIV